MPTGQWENLKLYFQAFPKYSLQYNYVHASASKATAGILVFPVDSLLFSNFFLYKVAHDSSLTVNQTLTSY